MSQELRDSAENYEDLWRRKYVALKKRCSDYQKRNAMLFLRAKEAQKVIQKAETETRYLVKKLEQYEEVDYPRCLPSSRASAAGLTLPSPHPLHTPTTHPLLLSSAATRIRAEVEAALSQESEQTNDKNETQQQQSELSSPKPVPEKVIISHGHPVSMTPQSTVLQGPPNLPSPSPISVPERTVFGPPKTKRIKRTVRNMSEKPLKSTGRGSAVKRRKGDIDPNAPKKPSNAFFWFCQARRAELQEQFKGEASTGQHDLTKALARLWGETPADDKKLFYEQYTRDKARYDQEMENYLKSKQAALTSPIVIANQNADDIIVNPEL